MWTFKTLLRYLFSLIALLLVHTEVSAASTNEMLCGELKNAYGPIDYRIATREQLSLVEGAHFTPDVEMLRRGKTGPISADLDYTLRVFPNSYRALTSLARLQLREKKDKLPSMHWPVECYFERAVRFAPDDPKVRQVYGYYLVRLGRRSEALTQIETASTLGSDSANLHYNLGLLYFDLGEFDKSLEHAWKADQMGFDLPGLKNKLKASGKWKDPP